MRVGSWRQRFRGRRGRYTRKRYSVGGGRRVACLLRIKHDYYI